MKKKICILLVSTIMMSCGTKPGKNTAKPVQIPLAGTWKLITGTLIEKGDTNVTDYTKDKSFIKIINEDHFAFLQHNLQKSKDSASDFSAGGGSYSLNDSTYTEFLEYCNAREWEGNHFTFTIHINNDTLVQQGLEKIEGTAVNRVNIEKYVRVKK